MRTIAKRIRDQKQRTQVLAGILTFTDKMIDEDCRERIKEEWEMTQIGKMIFDDGFQAGEKHGEKRGRELGKELGMDQKLVEQSCRKLRKGKTPEVIAMELEEDPKLIQKICEAASGFAPEYDFDQVYEAWNSSIAAL